LSAAAWRNWLGNETSAPRTILSPHSEFELRGAVAAASADGATIRTAGAGHSNTPLVATDELLVDLRHLRGVIGVDRERRTARVGAGTTIRDLGPALAARGLGLSNQGEIDAQTFGGAIATGTHGTGFAFGSLAEAVRAVRLVTADGKVIELDSDGADERIDAARVSLGALGVITELEIDVVPAYGLRESSWRCSFAEAIGRLDEILAMPRNTALFWMPSATAPARFDIAGVAPGIGADDCLVRTNESFEPDPAETPELRPGGRRGPSHLVYAYEFNPCAESELFVPREHAAAALSATRDRLLADPSLTDFPVLVRGVGADRAWLAPSYGRDSVAISICGPDAPSLAAGTRALEEELSPFDPRPHWGKLHRFDRDRLSAAFPRLPDFLRVRAELDPGGAFSNTYLRTLLGDRLPGAAS
jgi:FAD/FMN-containing dehydrogenase